MAFRAPAWVDALPSLVTETISGVACMVLGIVFASLVRCVLAGRFAFAPWWGILITAEIFAVVYERFRIFDANGWSWKDVGQRQLGIALGLALWLITLRVIG